MKLETGNTVFTKYGEAAVVCGVYDYDNVEDHPVDGLPIEHPEPVVYMERLDGSPLSTYTSRIKAVCDDVNPVMDCDKCSLYEYCDGSGYDRNFEAWALDLRKHDEWFLNHVKRKD